MWQDNAINKENFRHEDIKETNTGNNGRNAKDGRGNTGKRIIKVTERKKQMMIYFNCNWVVTRWQCTFTHKQYIEQHT
jgi:hypothetical protein